MSPPRRPGRVRGRARARAEEGVPGGLRPLPLLRAHARRDVPLQQARAHGDAAARVPVLQPAARGRLGLGQEPPDAHDPAHRDLRHLRRRHDRGAARRGRRAERCTAGDARRAASASPSRSPTRRRRSDVRHGRGCCSRSTSATRRRSSGSTTGDELGERWRIATEAQRTGDELGALLADFLDFDALDGICLSSTVPRLIREYEHVAERWAKAPLLVIGPGVKTGIQIQYDDPREVGPDRDHERGRGEGALRRALRSSSTSAPRRTSTSSPPRATTSAACSRPGVEVSMDALFARAARLVEGRLRRAADA